MASFKFWGKRAAAQSDGRAATAKNTARGEAGSVEFLRRRARHRLMGAVVLVFIAIVGFPLLFETEPRPDSVNTQVTIPSQEKAAPLKAPQVASGPVGQSSGLDSGEQVVTPGGAEAPAASVPQPDSAPSDSSSAPVTAPVTQAQASAAGAPAASTAGQDVEEAGAREDHNAQAAQEAQQAAAEKLAAQKAAAQKLAAQKAAEKAAAERLAAQKEKEAERVAAQKAAAEKHAAQKAAAAAALLGAQAKSAPASAAAPAAAEKGRYVIQIGAYADAGSVRSARASATLLGVHTYVEQVSTQAGPRTRVRVGPFTSRADADAAAGKLKRGGMPAQIIPG